MDPSERPAEPQNIEQLLGTFAARAPRVDRDRLMFLAGRAAAESEARPTAARTPWYWPASTLASTSVALILAVTLIVRDERGASRPDTTARSSPLPAASSETNSDASDSPRAEGPAEIAPPLVAQREAPNDSSLSSSAVEAIRWRELALREGVDALPIATESASSSASPLRYGSALQSLSQRPWSWIWDAN